MAPKTAAIMQPTYLPWLGYFDLLDQADVFVILDSVQFAKRSWQQRNRIKTSNGELVLTVPVLTKGRRDQRIDEVLIEPSARFGSQHLGSIRAAYSKAPQFTAQFPPIRDLLEAPPARLADLNLSLVDHFRRFLGIETPLVRSSTLAVSGSKVDLLIAICKEAGAARYLSPLGSKVYIDENNLFAANGIELAYHNYRHPVYRQLFGGFLPYMSILDLVMNEPQDACLSIVRSGRLERLPGNAPPR